MGVMRWARIIDRLDNVSHRIPMPHWLRCRICDGFDRAMGLTEKEIGGPR